MQMIVFERGTVMRFVPEVQPLADEVIAIEEADKSIERFGTVDYADVNWD